MHSFIVLESFRRMALRKRMAITVAFCCSRSCDSCTTEEDEDEEFSWVWITIEGF